MSCIAFERMSEYTIATALLVETDLATPLLNGFGNGVAKYVLTRRAVAVVNSDVPSSTV